MSTVVFKKTQDTYKLSDRLRNLKSMIAPVEEEWVLFCQDHRNDIISNSEILEIPDDDRWRYRYRIFDYLKDLGYDTNLTWLVYYINQIDLTQQVLGEDRMLYIPDLKYIRKMIQSYNSFKSSFATGSK